MNQGQAFANNSLFIGDLSKFCTEANLEGLFSSYGQVVDVKIKRNNTTGKTLSYGFVTFINEQCAASAMDQLNGVAFFGRNLRIRWAVHNAKAQKPAEESVINSVYVRFITPRVSEYITEEDFHRVFDPFGSILDVSIKESSIDPRTHRQSGYGFVHFTSDNDGIAAAFKAVSCIDNSTVESVTYNVELSKNLLKQFQEMKRNGTVDGNGLMIPTSGMLQQQQSGYSQHHHHQRGSSDGSITTPSTGNNNSMRSIPSSVAVGMGMGMDGYSSNSPHPAATAGSHSRWANNSPFPDASAGGVGHTTSRSPYANMPAPTPMRNYGHTQSHQLYPPSQTVGHQRSGSGGAGGYDAMYGGAYHPSGAYTGGPYGQVYGGAPYPQRHHPGMSGYDPSTGAPYTTGAQAHTQGHGGSYYQPQQHQQMAHQQQQQQYRNTATGTSAPIGIPGASQSPALSDHTDWPHSSSLSGGLSALAPSFQRGTSGGASHSVGSGKATSPLSSAAASFTSQGILDSSSILSSGGYIARSQSISPMPSRSPKMHQADALGGSLAVGSIPLHSSSARSHTGSYVRSLSESLDEDSLYGAVASYPPSQAAYSPMLEHSPYLDGHSQNSSFSSNATFGKPPPLNLQGLQYHNNVHSNGSTTNSVSGGSVYGSSASTSPIPTVRGGLTERLQAMKLGASAWEGDVNTSLASLRGGEGGISSSNKPPTPSSSRVLSAGGATPLSGPLRSQHLSHSFGSSSHSQHSTSTAAVGAGYARTVGHNPNSNNHLGILGITPSLPPSSLSARSDLHSRSTSNSSVSVHSDINRSGSISPQPFPASSSSASLNAHMNVRGIRTGNQSDMDLQGQAQQSNDLNALLAGFNNSTTDYINNSNNSSFTTTAITTVAPMHSLYADAQRTEQAVAASHLLLGRAPLQRQTPLSSESLEVDQLDLHSKLLESHSNSHSSELADTSIGAPLGEAYLRALEAKTRLQDGHSGEDAARGQDQLTASTLQCEYVENEEDDQDFMYSPASAASPNKPGCLSASSSSSFWFTSSSSCGGVDATAAPLLPGPHSFASFSCEGGFADGAFSSSSTSPDKKPTGLPSTTTTLRRGVSVHDQQPSSESNTDDQQAQSQQVTGIALSSEPSSATASTTMETDTSTTPPPATVATMDSASTPQAPALALSEEAMPKKSRQLSLMQFFKLSSTSSSSSSNPAASTSTTATVATRGTASSNEAK